MKLHADTRSGQNSVTAYGPGFVTVSGQRHERSLVLTPHTVEPDWPVTHVAEMQPAMLEALRRHHCDLWLIGTGLNQSFPHPSVLAPLLEARIGVEIMDTAAACRTFNILAAEGRNVGAALIITRQ